jgi:hypothetical protein
MTHLLRTVLLFCAALGLLSCGDDVNRPADQFTIDGTVEFRAVEGGCWFIRALDGQIYDPRRGLTEEFRQDGLEVRATLTVIEFPSVCQVGRRVDIVEIVRR